MSASHCCRAAWIIAATALVACAGRSAGPGPAHAAAKDGSRIGIEAAALPYQIIDARTRMSVDEPAFWGRLSAARAVCIGEEHRNPHQHWMQLHIVRELIARLPKGTRLALAMEMFQRPFQGVLDDYAARRIDAAALRSRSGYDERWGYDYGFYGPTIDAAVGAGAQLLAANAAKELTKKVVRRGLAALSPEEKAQIPDLALDDAAHRAWFDSVMEDMGAGASHAHADAKAGPAMPPHAGSGGGSSDPADGDAPAMPSADRVYLVQVIWDETMADTAARWLAANPAGHLILLAGNGHCHDTAIVNRIKRRGVRDALSIRGVIDDGEGSVSDALVAPMNDFVVVLQSPPGQHDGDGDGDADGDRKPSAPAH
jgi:uncharacterized iron-regulated protein